MNYPRKESERFRAHLFRFMGTPFFIPIGLITMDFINNGLAFTWLLIKQGLFSALLLTCGIAIFNISYSIMVNIEQEELKNV